MKRPRPSLLAALVALAALAGAAPAAAAPRAWSAPVTVTPQPAAQVFHGAVLALNAAGDAVVGWQRDSAGCCAQAGTVQVRGRSGPRGAWGRVRTLSRTPGSALLLAVNDRGEAVAAWSEADGVHVKARSGLDGPWLEEALPAPAPTGAVGGALTMDAAGRALLTLVTTAPGAVAVRTVHRPAPGQPWQAAADLGSSGTVRVAAAPSGAAIAVSLPASGPGTVSRRDPATLGWEAPVALVPPGASRTAAAMNDRGDAIVAWTLPGASGGGVGAPGLTQLARRPIDAAAWVGPATVATIPGALATASLNVSGQGLLAWSTQLLDQGNAVLAAFGDVRVGTWTESVASSLATEIDAIAGLDDRGRVVAVLHGRGGPGGRGVSYGLAPAIIGVWGAQQAWTECQGFAPAFTLDRPSGRAAAACEEPENGAPITVRSFDDLGPLALSAPRRAAPGASLRVRFAAPFPGQATLLVAGGGRVVNRVSADVRQGYGQLTLAGPGTRGRYTLRVIVRPATGAPITDRAPLTVR